MEYLHVRGFVLAVVRDVALIFPGFSSQLCARASRLLVDATLMGFLPDFPATRREFFVVVTVPQFV